MNSTNAQMIKTKLLIDNKDVATSEYLEVKDPGNFEERVGLLAQATKSQVDQAVTSAHEAFKSWSRTDLQTRSELLLQAAAILEAEAPHVIELMARESGMLLTINKAEIGMAANIVRDNVELAAEFLKPKQIEDAASWVSIEKRPIGVIAGIVSWNAPVILTMRKLAPALVCGNTIVIKPSPFAAMGISLLLKKMAAIFPPGVINVVHGGAEVGDALTSHPLIRKISFTGGAKVAETIMKSAAKSIKDVQFELGGNDPAIILDDADIEDLMPKLVGGVFRRSGQFCFAVKRIYVPEIIYDRFFTRLIEEVAKFKVGHPLATGVTFGPMNNRHQYQFIKDMIDRTRKSGAEVIELGEKLNPSTWDGGYYLLPAVVKHASPDLEVVLTEQFGPVIPVVSYRTETDVIRMANQTELGLGSSVWSSDFDRALAVARQLEAGMTFINQAGTSRLGQKNIPFGGVKQSGIGRESSEIGLGEYVEYHGINYHKI
jgi:acyl-CoA reductase-like NAD-dependent aldehyde dehydrogenase